MELWTPEQAKRHVPVLKEAEFDGAAWCGTDGVLDIHALLSGYLKAASAKGARIRYASVVQSIDAAEDGLTVVVNGETVKARVVINASGAWANTIASWRALQCCRNPCRRHLFVAAARLGRPELAFVWDVTPISFVEGEGLLRAVINGAAAGRSAGR
jgi:glycine/D-amino acid oxidase-like deaminating enzyme